MDKTWKVVLAFAVIFMAGAGTGSLIALRFAKKFMPQPREPGVVVEQFSMMYMQRLAGRLELTDGQKEKIRPILQKTGEDIRRLSHDSQRETHDVMARMDDQVSALLTPEQQKRFVEMQRRRNQEFQNRGYRGPGGPPMGGGRLQGPRSQRQAPAAENETGAPPPLPAKDAK